MAVEMTYETHVDKYTSYRLIPNPDGEPGTGFSQGAVLQHKDRNDKEWVDYFFVGPESLADVSEMFARAAQDVKGTTQ